MHISLTRKDIYQKVIEDKTNYLQKMLALNDRDRFEVNLILDEICTNIFENNKNVSDLKITVEISWQDKNLKITFQDNGAPFDPTSVPEPDTTLPLTKRQAGGLGLFFVKRYSQTLSYARIDNKNQTTVKKLLR